jgi:hypothetical protein
MALSVSQRDIVNFKQRVDRMTAKAKGVIEKSKHTVETVVTTTEVGAAAFLFGLAQGKFGGIQIVGVPLDLLAGIGLHIAAFAGVGGKGTEKHMHAFADGALASFFNHLGRDVGYAVQTPADRERIAKFATAKNKKFATLPNGQYSFGVGSSGGASLADEELARMVSAGRR